MRANTTTRPSAPHRLRAAVPPARPVAFAVAALVLLLAIAPGPALATPSATTPESIVERAFQQGACYDAPPSPPYVESINQLIADQSAAVAPAVRQIMEGHICADPCKPLEDETQCRTIGDGCPDSLGMEPACVNDPERCTDGKTGAAGVCVTISPHGCADGQVGYWLACYPDPGLAGEPCEGNDLGYAGVCLAQCGDGRFGYEAVCVDPDSICPLFTVGVPPDCIPVPIIVPPVGGCDEGQAGSSGVCVDGPGGGVCEPFQTQCVGDCDPVCEAGQLASFAERCPGVPLDYYRHGNGSAFAIFAKPSEDEGYYTLSYAMEISDAPSGIPGLFYVGGMTATWQEPNWENPEALDDHKDFGVSVGNYQPCVEFAKVLRDRPFSYSVYGGYLGVEASASCTLTLEVQVGFPDSHAAYSVSCTATITTSLVMRLHVESLLNRSPPGVW